MVVKTFRGLLADAAQDRIRLQTIKGKVGYRIVKFELFPLNPGTASQESVVEVTKTSTATTGLAVNFTDTDLLAVGYLLNHLTATDNPAYMNTIFDNEMFNQDIYVMHNDVKGTASCNYYLELEVIPLDDAGAEYTTLKDMRSA